MRAEGKADVVNGASWLSRLVARFMHLPKEGKDRVLTLETSWDGDTIVWRRVSGGRGLVSRQTIEPGRLTESFRWSRMEFAAEADGSKVIFTSGRVKVLGVALPRALCPVTIATIQAAGNGWESTVSISVPLFGLLCEYTAQTETV